MKISYETIEAQNMVYMRRVGAYGEENFVLMEKMKQWMKSNNLYTDKNIIYAIAQDDVRLTNPENCRYDVCVVTDKNFGDEVYKGKLPSGYYMICKIPHTTKDLKLFWESLFIIVQKENKILDTNRPILERYVLSLVNQGLCEFCIPINCCT